MLILFYWYRLVSSILQLILDLTDGGVEDPMEVLERIRLESVRILLEPLPLVELIVPDAFHPFRIDRIPEKLENGFQLRSGIRQEVLVVDDQQLRTRGQPVHGDVQPDPGENRVKVLPHSSKSYHQHR